VGEGAREALVVSRLTTLHIEGRGRAERGKEDRRVDTNVAQLRTEREIMSETRAVRSGERGVGLYEPLNLRKRGLGRGR